MITRLNVGGPAINATLLTARLDPLRFTTHLVAGRESEREASMLDLGVVDRVAVERVPSLGRRVRIADDLGAVLALIRIARSYRPDLVHTHLAKAGLVGRIAARMSGARAVVHTYHGSVFRSYFGPIASAAYLQVERALALLTSRVIAITPRQRAELVALRIAPPSKIVEIPLGFDLRRFAEPIGAHMARDALGLPQAGPVVGIVARLVPIKDIATFLHALALARASVPELHAVVVGDGEERERLEAMSRDLGLAGRCRFLGWRADMPRVYAALDMLVLTSLNEGSPVSVIEAMAAGIPVVATAVGGVPDVVADGVTGSLVPPRDPRAAADAIGRLLRDPSLRDRWGHAGRELAWSRYRVERLIADVERLYDELLGAGSS